MPVIQRHPHLPPSLPPASHLIQVSGGNPDPAGASLWADWLGKGGCGGGEMGWEGEGGRGFGRRIPLTAIVSAPIGNGKHNTPRGGMFSPATDLLGRGRLEATKTFPTINKKLMDALLLSRV